MSGSRLVVIVVVVGLVAACSYQSPAIDGGSGADGQPDGDPNRDTDGDMIFDDVDNCILIPNPLQRDHDADGHGDECDRCPHLTSGPDPDADGDGVGDACDPRPGLPDVRRMWFGFYDAAEIATWVGNTLEFAVGNGTLQRTFPTGTGGVWPNVDVTDAYIATAVTPTAISAGSGTRSVGALVARDAAAIQYYTCHGRDTSGSTFAGHSGVWSGGSSSDTAPLGLPLAVGTRLEIVERISAAGVTCLVTTPTPAVIPVGATTIGPSTTGMVELWADDFSAEWDYLFVVEPGP